MWHNVACCIHQHTEHRQVVCWFCGGVSPGCKQWMMWRCISASSNPILCKLQLHSLEAAAPLSASPSSTLWKLVFLLLPFEPLSITPFGFQMK
mmetsp:Transcript_24136/g.38266  ORF Transcript_24136/g.38266 Transcript_24136/m.38266 type:complete len:93 (+) Transcript_24136:471-749(+)